jgi:predicted nucleotidyltransferase
MQKTTDKLIKKQLEEEAGQSLKEALKKSILSPSERKAAGETAKNIMEDRFTQMGRAEVFKSAEYPEFIGRKGTAEEKRLRDKLIKALTEAEKELKSILGDNFIAISLCGSWAKGYAGRKSDVDLYLLLKAENAKVDDALAILHNIGKALKVRVEENPFCIEEIKGLVRKVDSNWEKTDDAAEAAVRVSAFFSGKVFGDDSKIHAARKEIIEGLAKNPYGDVVWDGVRLFHYIGIAGLARKHTQTAGNVIMRLGVSMEDFHEILKARGEFALPSFEEIKKRYGVA